jgi:hypothetical protein
MARYERMDLPDAAIVVMSELHPRRQVLTVDRRDFSVYRRNDKTATKSFGFDTSCAASPKCFTLMAPVGATLIGQELHQH